jgi:hypothetical protein
MLLCKNFCKGATLSLILAESQNLIVTNEFEEVYLNFKKNNRKVRIGDFYGDPQAAAISDDESFCVMVGCGLIIYYLHEPYVEYEYNTSEIQWKEFFRTEGRVLWIEDVDVMDSLITFTVEKADIQNGGRYQLNMDSLELSKCI